MRRLSLALLVALAAAGCKKSESPAPAKDAAAPGAPAAAPADAGAPQASIQGKVVERLDAPPYSYLKIKAADGEKWAAVPKTEVKDGADVTVTGAMPMQGFESKTLKRKFDVVYFGTLAGEGAGAAAATGMPPPGMPGMPPGNAPVNMAEAHKNAGQAQVDVGDVKVPKASGADARTIAEIYAQKAALKEKAVTLRGKVVKVNENIMNKNWLHLRDGTGGKEKDNDITVITSDKATVGDVVTVKGTVKVDKDIGAGYAWPVVIEDAKVSK